jgi:catechol 2,3-dioxygenase-like lactoylglutathione lyase family enzyme
VTGVVGLNHVSVVAKDLEESVRFYVDVLGLERIPSPNFAFPVAWLRAGDLELHLFELPGKPPPDAHFGLEIDDFMDVYRRVKELGLLDDRFGNVMFELPDGAIQMYVRDPAGNLVELDYPDASSVPVDEVPEYRRLADDRPQDGEAAEALLFLTRVRGAA